MSYFRIVGIGAQAPGPIEKIARSAAAAEVERSNLQPLCGRHGKVEVSTKGRRTISLERLRRLAQDEALAGYGDGRIPESGDNGPHRSQLQPCPGRDTVPEHHRPEIMGAWHKRTM